MDLKPSIMNIIVPHISEQNKPSRILCDTINAPVPQAIIPCIFVLKKSLKLFIVFFFNHYINKVAIPNGHY